MCARSNNRKIVQILALTFVYRDACEAHVLAHTTGLTFDGQDIAFFRSAHVRDMNIGAEPR